MHRVKAVNMVAEHFQPESNRASYVHVTTRLDPRAFLERKSGMQSHSGNLFICGVKSLPGWAPLGIVNARSNPCTTTPPAVSESNLHGHSSSISQLEWTAGGREVGRRKWKTDSLQLLSFRTGRFIPCEAPCGFGLCSRLEFYVR